MKVITINAILTTGKENALEVHHEIQKVFDKLGVTVEGFTTEVVEVTGPEDGTPVYSSDKTPPAEPWYDVEKFKEMENFMAELSGVPKKHHGTIDNTGDIDPIMVCKTCGFPGYQKDLDRHICKVTIL
jgi:hypothetical protein